LGLVRRSANDANFEIDTRCFAQTNNTILLTQLLVKVIAIEKHLKVGMDDYEKVMNEVKLIVDNALEKSSVHLVQIIAELAMKQKD